MATEDVDQRFVDLDAWPLAYAIQAMWEGQLAAAASVQFALPMISAATEAAAEALRHGGRLIYVGAGTSGRIAVQDGVELPPTFGWPQSKLVFALAGGTGALLASVEGAEDDATDGRRQMDTANVGAHDVVIGVAASGSTPFTVAAIRRAAELGAVTIGVSNNPGASLLAVAGFPVLVETGTEVIAGSTRMKAGTAQKIVLNLISSGIMLRLGRVYHGLMVDMQVSNKKLERRAEAMVQRLVGCSPEVAAQALRDANDRIKLAVLIAGGRAPAQAEKLLASHDGNLRKALATGATEELG